MRNGRADLQHPFGSRQPVAHQGLAGAADFTPRRSWSPRPRPHPHTIARSYDSDEAARRRCIYGLVPITARRPPGNEALARLWPFSSDGSLGLRCEASLFPKKMERSEIPHSSLSRTHYKARCDQVENFSEAFFPIPSIRLTLLDLSYLYPGPHPGAGEHGSQERATGNDRSCTRRVCWEQSAQPAEAEACMANHGEHAAQPRYSPRAPMDTHQGHPSLYTRSVPSRACRRVEESMKSA